MGPSRPEGSSLAAIVAAIFIILGVLVLWPLGDRFLSNSVDAAHHYQLAHYVSLHLSSPDPDGYGAGGMSSYPAASHWLAAFAGAFLGSTFLGMHLVSIAATALIWLCVAWLLLLLEGNAKWFGLSSLGLVLALASKPLVGAPTLHGHEVVLNYLFAQLVGQVLFWLCAVLVAVCLLRRYPYATWAVPMGFLVVVTAQFHLLPATEILFLLGVISAISIGDQVRAGRLRTGWILPPVVVPVASAVALTMTPSFRVSRTLARWDGGLAIPHFETAGDVAGLALGVVVMSLGVGFWAWRGRRDREVLLVLASIGLAVALPCLLQMGLLQVGEGSAYAVKKYGFGLFTVVVVQLCALVGIAGRAAVRDHQVAVPRYVEIAAAGAVAVLATSSVFSSPPVSRTSDVVALEKQLGALEQVTLIDSEGKRNYAVSLPGANPVLDYMFSISVLWEPTDIHRERLSSILGGTGIPPNTATGLVVTAEGSDMDSVGCRVSGPSQGVVVVDYECAQKSVDDCLITNTLALGGSVRARQLTGFSQAESQGRWTSEEKASFVCVVPKEWEGLPAEVSVVYLGSFPSGSSQDVSVSVGGETKDFAISGADGAQKLVIAVPDLRAGEVVVELHLPDSVSPSELGVSGDQRQLGIYIQSIEIEAG